MMRAGLLMVVLFAGSGCLTGGAIELVRIDPPCNPPHAVNAFITSEERWRSLCPAALEVLDFSDSTVVVASWGGFTGGYRVSIDAVVDRGRYAEVYVTRWSPGIGCAVTAANSLDVAFVVVARPNLRGWVTPVYRVVNCPP